MMGARRNKSMIVMSYGGGKQTVAMVTMILDGKLPKPDMIVMADTSRECKTTFEYMNHVVQPALKEIGMRVEIAGHDLAHMDLYSKDKLLLPVFTINNGKLGKMPTF
jgi:3'-phosphoadenosine 5'-phosphosulfate sulfotransferase (PAPS reductase)/FAD synthetase